MLRSGRQWFARRATTCLEMPVVSAERPIPVIVSFGGKSVEFAISHDLAEHCLREIPGAMRECTESALADSEIEGGVALELSRHIDRGLTSDIVRDLAAEDAAYLLAGMLSAGNWEEAQQIELHLLPTDSVARLDLRLVLICADGRR
jgi:hypothetical protein